jgi:hypothetical protein
MGNSSSRKILNQRFSQGESISISTEKDVYQVAESIQGWVTLELRKQVGETQLFVNLDGDEVFTAKTMQSQGQKSISAITQYTKLVQTFEKKTQSLIHMAFPIQQWESLGPGQYILPFCFHLPSHLPGTFDGHAENIWTKIQYKIKVELCIVKGHEKRLRNEKTIIVSSPHTRVALINTLHNQKV